ncbi:thiosulfate/3-mercaptopyruvate sulfurtransferase [Agrococcus baldri]|uniref:Sulfurtransferase n=1 Tax=Agrococcus baldri TaxID=153730 RepID=A0AA94HMC4_9MICO|nr:sulfurtransferase [Agrococcus baldri]SFS10659.1 thiosulfate/3-mercaptopyruvate sulfurtransferase [Agrococcus baldri]
MRDLVSVDWLAEHLREDALVVVDASMAPPGTDDPLPTEGIPGAVRFDIDGRFSRQDAADGLGQVGVHDMLAPADFERELRAIGLRAGDRVVATDAAGIYSSARAWWMLRAAGIDAAVLDGGLPAWTEAGHPLAPVAESTGRTGDVTVVWDASAIVDADVTAAALASGQAAVLDARSPSRYSGAEPDPREGVRAGHMPGAVSLHYGTLAPEGRMLPTEALAQRLQEAAGERPIIASCGSGVTAAVIALAATLAGREAAVYDGSWSEWGQEGSGRPVAEGD